MQVRYLRYHVAISVHVGWRQLDDDAGDQIFICLFRPSRLSGALSDQMLLLSLELYVKV